MRENDIFDQLTGLHQYVSNWLRKTVKHAEGTLVYDGYTFDVVDLPRTYSLEMGLTVALGGLRYRALMLLGIG